MIYAISICLITGAGLLILGLIESVAGKLNQPIRNTLKALTAIFMVLSICFVGVVYFFASMGEAAERMCSDNISSRSISPNSAHIAYVFTRDCGAVTKFSDIVPIVMLRSSSQRVEFKDQHIIFRQDWLGREIDDIIYSGDFGRLRWLSDNHLQIELNPNNTGQGRASWNDIKISYVQPYQKKHKQNRPRIK